MYPKFSSKSTLVSAKFDLKVHPLHVWWYDGLHRECHGVVLGRLWADWAEILARETHDHDLSHIQNSAQTQR